MPSTELTDDQWSSLGFRDVVEIGGGWQSHVFSAWFDNQRLAVKLTQADVADRQLLQRRSAMVAELAILNSSVVPPVPVSGTLVYPIGDWLMTSAPFVESDPADQSRTPSGEVLGTTLADLHRSMRHLPAIDVPRVAALEAGLAGRPVATASDQILHGDFAASNTVLTPEGLRVLDFDDSGYGPIEFDIANSLYMVMFDTWANDRSPSSYADFRAAFTSSYADVAGREVPESTVDEMIAVRVNALKQWISNPPDAPIGIRNSSPDWIASLHRFVAECKSGDWSSIQ